MGPKTTLNKIFDGNEDCNEGSGFCGKEGRARVAQCHAIGHAFAMRPGPAATAARMSPRTTHMAPGVALIDMRLGRGLATQPRELYRLHPIEGGNELRRGRGPR